MITLNGRAREASPGTTIGALLADFELPDRGVAVAIDAEVVPRGEWGDRTIEDGANVEVVTAVQGG